MSLHGFTDNMFSEAMYVAFHSNFAAYIAPFQITVLVRFSSVWFSLVTVLLIVCPRSLLLCPFHKKLRIWWKWGKLNVELENSNIIPQDRETTQKHTERDSFQREILFAVNGCIFWFLKLAALIFPLLPVFKDPILSTLCLLFVPEEEELVSPRNVGCFICVLNSVVSPSCGIMLQFSSST